MLSTGDEFDYSYDEVGDVVLNGLLGFVYGDDRRMVGNGSRHSFAAAYDGRGFLSEMVSSQELPQGQRNSTHPTYNSAGLLLHRNSGHPPLFLGLGGTSNDLYVFYFAGRPVATLENATARTSTSTLRFLSTDHLGTPVLMTDAGGSQVWQGGFEPFGADYSSSSTPLRLPGQWTDPNWSDDTAGLYYNVNRWYDGGTGRYTQADPLGVEDEIQPYLYVGSKPMQYIDPLGLSKIRNHSCVTIYVKDEHSSSLIKVRPNHYANGDGFYNSSNNSCLGFGGRGNSKGNPAPEVYKVNDWTDVTITGGCNGGCLDFHTSGPVSWTSNTLDWRTGWQGKGFLAKHPDWPKPPTPPSPCCSLANWK